MKSCQNALKEWAVVCDALARGTQLLLFRKGGMHEGPAGFRPEHAEFWLFPTGFHQSLDSVQPPFQEQARQVLESPPPAGQIPIQHFCRITQIQWCDSEQTLERLLPFQILDRDALLTRFHYRKPGLFLIRVDVNSLVAPVLIPVDPQYDGCHSWVNLNSPISTAGLTNFTETPAAERLQQLDLLLSQNELG